MNVISTSLTKELFKVMIMRKLFTNSLFYTYVWLITTVVIKKPIVIQNVVILKTCRSPQRGFLKTVLKGCRISIDILMEAVHAWRHVQCTCLHQHTC